MTKNKKHIKPFNNRKRMVKSIILISVFVLFTACNNKDTISNLNCIRSKGIHKLEYNNPGLLVDLDVGFKSVPMPMDFDGDGDIDLLVSESGSYAESGVFYYENISGNVEMPVFRYGMRVSTERYRLGSDGMFLAVSEVNGHTHVLTPDRVNDKLMIYVDVPQNVFWDDRELPIPARGYIPGIKNNTWKMIDFDGDSVYDLMCGIGSREGSFLLFFKNSGTDDNPKYNKPEKIRMENGELIGKSLRLESPLADYDNDGDLDYIGVGAFSDFIYFENIGTPKKYKFKLGRKLTYNGKPIQMVSKYGSAIKPRAVDFNKDGFVDIIAGDEDGKVSFIKNTGKVVDGIPQFLLPQFFQQEARFVDFGALTAPRVFDWDGDGLEDIISGNGAGYIGFFKNLGGYPPKWAAPELLKADGKKIRLIADWALENTEEPHWGYTTIDVGYWDDDDLPDIIANEHNGNIVWFRNTGTRTEPVLAAPKPLLVEWKDKPQKPAWVPGISEGNELLAPWRTSPFIMDFNDDGLNDLVMLDYQGYLAVFIRYKENGKLLLAHPERNFVYPSGEPVLLNQRKGSSSGRLKITFADWDGDGLDDLIFSSKPAVDWMKNMGMKDGKMVLQYMGRVVSRTLMGHTDGPVVSDFNKDGIPDLLVGTETGVFYYWERTDIIVTTTMTTTGKQLPANYKYFKR